MSRKILSQIIRFCIVGGGGLLINLLVTRVGVAVFHQWYLFSFLVATLFGWTFIFIANAFITFPEHRRSRYTRKYSSFLLGYLGIFSVNAGLVYFLTSTMGVHYLISIILSTFITAILTFLFSKHAIYQS